MELSQEQLASLSPDQYAAALTEGREKFLANIKNISTKGVTDSYTAITLVVEMLYSELEHGSKELMTLRELFFLVSTQTLTQERWTEVVTKLQGIKDERMKHYQQVQQNLSTLTTTTL